MQARIEFPCDYPIKIVGENRDAFTEQVVELTRRHAADLSDDNIRVKASRAGTYCSVTVTIRATGEAQLKALFETLKQHPLVKMVL
jgi:putative lipoic acid-binding regulatory protein